MIGQSAQSETIYEFARVNTLEGWWVWTLFIGSAALLVYFSVRWYRRDVVELNPPIRWSLIALRLLTMVALVFFFLNLQRRTQRVVTRQSEVAVLVDTSQSMSLPAATTAESDSRSERATKLLADSELLSQLGAEHQVSVYGFGDESEPRLIESIGGIIETETASADSRPARSSQIISLLAAGLIVLGCLALMIALIIGAVGNRQVVGWWLIGCLATLIPGIILLGSIYAIHTDQSLAQILQIAQPSEPAAAESTEDAESEKSRSDPDQMTDSRRPTSWGDEIAASAPQSRIGDAIRAVLASHDPATLSGIVMLSDGQSNGGVDVNAAIASARRLEVPVFPLGIGSSDAPINVRVVDLDAPRRVYPGDSFAVAAVLQGSGPQPIQVTVQLLDGLDQSSSETVDPSSDGQVVPPPDVVDSQQITVNNDGTLTGIRFEMEPENVGRRRLAIRVIAPTQDKNAGDDIRDARYEVVSRKLRVMTIAGGPTREYRFVRNLLYRDKSIELDTWLQTGQPGISQDADRLLLEFPQTATELFEYDAIVMFDPDWTAIDAASLDLLDRWISQQAGGMILIGGPVYHPQWTRRRTDPRVPTIAGFFPINISTRSSIAATGRQGGETAWPLKFTPEARRAEFLWIADDARKSFDVWDAFGGVYDYVDAKSAKPGAKVYAYFSDPTTEISGSLPVYLASHFYGAGRVYFQGSGEMWRLRSESDAYFDSYYTKLVRWVGEGRLLRDSNRGVLLVDSARAQVGDTIAVRAVLTDDQFEPLDAPEVSAKLLAPGGRIDDLRLLPQQGEPRAGTYATRFVVREAGSYEIRLTLGDALNEQVLRQSVQVRLPTVELERPRRNDTLLASIATSTEGEYLPIDSATDNATIVQKLNSWLRPQLQTSILPGAPDRDFTQRRNATLMWLIPLMLTMEWVVRRLHRLA